MARSIRIRYPGAVYHVIARGNHGQAVLGGNIYRKLFLQALGMVVLAWWLRQRTTVPLRWVSERLVMGHFTRVSQAIGEFKRRPGREYEQLRRLLVAS